jgi:hypothetical protein
MAEPHVFDFIRRDTVASAVRAGRLKLLAGAGTGATAPFRVPRLRGKGSELRSSRLKAELRTCVRLSLD